MQPTIFKMLDKFIPTDCTEKYFTPAQRQASEVDFNSYGQLYYKETGCVISNAKELMFAMDKKNKIYASTAKDINHSYLLAGEDVLGAGFLGTNEDGHVFYINNNSGHYCPTMQGMLYVLDFIFCKSSIFSEEITEFENYDEVPTKQVITTYSLSSLVNTIKDDEDGYDFEDLLLDVTILRQNSKSPSPVKLIASGYDTKSEPTEIVIESRFGCNPKRRSLTNFGLFSYTSTSRITLPLNSSSESIDSTATIA